MQAAINPNEVLQNMAIYWEDEIWSYPTYAIQTSEEQVQSVHLRSQHWFLSNWDDKWTYFTLGISLPDIDSHNSITKFTKKSWGMIRVNHAHLGYHAGHVIDVQSDQISVRI